MGDLDVHLDRLEESPDDAQALSAVEEIYTQDNRLGDLAKLYDVLAAQVEPTMAANLWMRGAKLYIEALQQPVHAEPYLKQALHADPSDQDASRTLRQLYLERGAVSECVELYEKELRSQDASPDVSDGWVEIATLCVNRLKDHGRALNALEEAITADGLNPEPYRVRGIIHEERGRPRLVFDALLNELRVGGLDETRLTRLRELTQEMVKKPRLHALASQGAQKLAEIRDDDPVALTVQHELELCRKDWKLKVLELDGRAMHVSIADEKEAARLWLEVAELQLAYGEHRDAALVSLDKALGASPGDEDGLALLRDVYEENGRYGALAEELEKMAGTVKSQSQSIELSFQAAQLYEEELGNTAAAARLYRQVLEKEPESDRATDKLANYYLDNGQAEEALRVLEPLTQNENVGLPLRIAGRLRMASICENSLDDHSQSLLNLEEILALEPTHKRAAAALEQAYREEGQEEGLARLLTLRLDAVEPRLRMSMMQDLGELYAHKLERPDEAIDIWGELYEVNASSELRESLQALAINPERARVVSGFLSQGADAIFDGDLKQKELAGLANFQEYVVEDYQAALGSQRKILQVGAGTDEGYDAISRLLMRLAPAGQAAEYFQDQSKEAVDPRERVGTLHLLAGAYKDSEQFEEAADVWRRILDIEPTDTASFESLSQFLRDSEEFEELIARHESRISHLELGEESGLACRDLAKILEESGASREDAAGWYIKAIEDLGDEPHCVEALDQMFEEGIWPLEIAKTLEPIFSENGNHAGEAKMLEVLVEDEKVEFAAADMWRRLLELYDNHLEDQTAAYRCAAQSFGFDKRNDELADTLLRLSDSPDEYLATRDAFRGIIEKLKGKPLQRMSLRAAQAGLETEEKLGALEDVLRAYGEDEVSRQGAAEVVRKLVPADLDSEGLYALGNEHDEALTDLCSRFLWMDWAQGFENDWENIGRAVDSWEKVRTLPSPPDACVPALDRLYEVLGEPERFANYLQSRFEEELPLNEKLSVGSRLMDVFANDLSRFEESILCGEILAGLCPDERWVWEKLAELYFETSNPEGASQCYGSELPLVEDNEERLMRALHYASGFGNRLGDMLESEKILRRVFSEAPGHEAGCNVCRDLYHATDRANVKRALGSLWIDETERAELYQDLVEFCEAHVPLLEAEAHAVPLLVRMANWYKVALGDGANALDCLTRAFSLRPRDRRLEETWIDQAREIGDWQTVLDALEVQCDSGSEKDIVYFRGRRAGIMAEEQKNVQAGIDELLRLRGGELPGDIDSLRMLCGFARDSQQSSLLADALEALHVLLGPGEAEEKLKLFYELAELCETQLKDFDRARAALRLAQKSDRDPMRALRWQERLLDGTDNTDALVEVLEHLIDPLIKNADVRDDLLKKGRLHHQLGEYGEALECYERALDHSRHDPGAIAGLEALVDQGQCVGRAGKILEPIYTVNNQHEKLAWLLGHRLDEVEDDNERKHLLRRLGELMDVQLDSPGRAFEFGSQAIEVDPADAGLRMWLEGIAQKASLEETLAELYARMAPDLAEPLNLQYHRRAAERFHHDIKNLSAATDEYRAILRLKPKDEKSLSGLEQIFRETSDYESWIDVLRMRIDNEPGRDRVVAYLKEIASIYAEGLNDKLSVAKTWRELYDFAPETTGTFDALENLYQELGDKDGSLKLYVDERERLLSQDSEAAMSDWLDLTTRQAQLHYEQFDDALSCVALLREVFEDEPAYPAADQWLRDTLNHGNTHITDFMDERYLKLGAYEDLVEVLEVKLRYLVDPGERSRLLIRIADLRNDELGQPRQALGALSLALRESPDSFHLLDRMWDIGRQHSMWRDAGSLIRKSLVESEPELKFQWFFRLAECARDELEDFNEAISSFEVCIGIQPDNIASLRALDSLYGNVENWSGQAQVKEKLLELVQDPSQRAELLLALSYLYDERLDKVEAARKSCERLVEEQPAHLKALERQAELFRRGALWSPLEKNLRLQQSARTELGQLVALHRELAKIYDEHLDFPTRSIDSWRDLLVIADNDLEAQLELDRLLTGAKRFPELLDHLSYMLTHGAQGDRPGMIYFRRAQILRDELNEAAQARNDWESLLELEPEHIEALESLAELLFESKEFDAWTKLMLRRLALPDEQYCERKLELIKVLGGELERNDEANAHTDSLLDDVRMSWQQLSELATISLEQGRAGQAVEALSEAVNRCPEVGERAGLLYRIVGIENDVLKQPTNAIWAWEKLWAEDKTDLKAYEALAQLYRQEERWTDLVELHEEALPGLDERATVDALQAILEIQSIHLEMPERAFMTAGRLYRLKPEDIDAAQSLIDLGGSLGCVDEAVAILEDQLDDIRDSRIRLSRLLQLGDLYHRTLKDLDEAEGAFERSLEIDPECGEALDGLLRVAIDDERFDKQLAALERKQIITKIPEDKKSILVEMGRIWENEIGDASRAVSIFQRVLELLPGDPDALVALSRLYDELANHEALAEVLEQRVEKETDLEAGVALRMRLAKLWAGPLVDPSVSVRWLDSLLILDGENREAWELLEQELRKIDGRDGLRDLFIHQLSVLEAPPEKVKVLRKLSSVYADLFDNLEGAADCLEDVLQLDPDNLEVVNELESLLRKREDWSRLITIMSHHLKLLSDPDEKAQVYLDMGEVYHTHLARVDLAEQAYNQVRVLKPESPIALHALGQLYERSGNWFQSLDMLGQEAELTTEPQAASKLYQRMGRIEEQMLMNREGAADAYRRALELDPEAIVAIESLKSMASESEDWGSYIRYLKMEIDVTEDEEDRFELHVEAADYYDRVEEDDLKALEQLERAIDIEPADVDCTAKLAEYHFRNENYEASGQYYRRLLNLTDGSATPAEVCHRKYRLGYTYEKLEDLENALRHYQEAVNADPSNLAAQEALAQMLLSFEQYEQAKEVFDCIIEEHKDELTASEIVDIHWQLGDLELRAGRLPNARSGFEKALELDPNHVLSLKALAGIDGQMGQWDLAYERLDRYSRLIPLDSREPVYLEMAKIASEYLGDSAKELEPLVRGARLEGASADLLEKLADVLLRRSEYQQAGAVLKKAATACTDIPRKAGLLHRLGRLYEQELDNEPLALKAYHVSLDLEPTKVDAFQDMERLLVKRQEWKLLEECYRAMLGRAQNLTPNFRLVLWRNLAELYDRALQDVDNAIMAYEVVRQMDTSRDDEAQRLAALYLKSPKHRAKATEIAHELFSKGGNYVEEARKLKELYHAQSQFDGVFMYCNILDGLGQATDDEYKMLAHLKQGVRAWPQRALGEDGWQTILLEDLQSPVGILAAELARLAPDAFTQAPKKLGLKKKDFVSLDSELYLAGILRRVHGTLGLSAPGLCIRKGSMEPPHLAPSSPPALVIGQNNAMTQSVDAAMTRFLLAYQLSFVRPELFLTGLYPGEQLRELLMGLCVVYNRSLQGSEHAGVNRWASHFEKIPGEVLRALQDPARRAYNHLLNPEGAARLARAAHLSAARAGLIMAGELAPSLRGLQQVPATAPGLSADERLSELTRFAGSKEHLRLREKIGSGLEIKGKKSESRAP